MSTDKGFGLAPIKAEGATCWYDPRMQQLWDTLSAKEKIIALTWYKHGSRVAEEKPFSFMPQILRRFFDYAHLRFPV